MFKAKRLEEGTPVEMSSVGEIMKRLSHTIAKEIDEGLTAEAKAVILPVEGSESAAEGGGE